MFSFEFTKLVRKILGSSRKTAPPRPATRLWLEVLEDRTLPSVSTLPMSVASPPAAPQNAAVTSFVVSMIDQWSYLVATIQQDVLAAYQALGQQIAQHASAVELQWDHILGISPSAANPSSDTAVSQPATHGATTANHAPAQALHPSTTTSDHEATQTLHAGRTSSVTSPDVSAAPAISNYLWDPPNPSTDIKASTPGNWLLNGVRATTKPGTNASDQVTFDPGNGLITDGNGNANINWDYNAKFSTMEVGGAGAYTGWQTIKSGLGIQLTGSNLGTALNMPSNPSSLNVDFSDASSYFQVDDTATITNMTLAGNNGAWFNIAAGTTTIAQSNYKENVGVNIQVGAGALLNDQSQTTLNLTNTNLQLYIRGAMWTYWGPNGGINLIDSSVYTSDLITVDGGVLVYNGGGGTKDTYNVPVLVENGGSFNLTVAGGQQTGGWLIVKGGNLYTSNSSVFLTGNTSSVELYNGDTLEADNDYSQTSGTLETMDASTCTLQDGPAGNPGTVSIAGGKLVIDQPSNGYGTLNVKANWLNFAGQLQVGINGAIGGPSNCDLLIVSGVTNLNAGATLYVLLNNAAVQGNSWIIIQDQGGNITGDFAQPITTNPPTPGLNAGVNPRDNTQYILSF